MTWREELEEASLDGVQFYYQNHKTSGGRKKVITEIPDSDVDFHQDKGRKPYRFQMSAHLVGPNYHVDRNDLVEVLNRSGPKDFVHPYFGSFTVELDEQGYSFEESVDEGGFVSFSFTLVENGLGYPTVSDPSDLQVVSQAAAVQNAVVEETPFDIIDAIGDVFDAVQDAIFEATSFVQDINNTVNSIINQPSKIDAAIDAFESQISQLMNTPQQLIGNLKDIVSSINNLINNFDFDTEEDERRMKTAIYSTVEDAMNFQVKAKATVTPTPQNKIEQDSKNAVVYAVKATYLSGFCTNLVSINIESSDEALQLATLVSSYFQILAEDPLTTPVLYEELLTLRTAIVNYLTYLAKNTPAVQLYTPPATTVALVLAYELLGDSKRSEELIDENNIFNPSFVMGGRELRYIP